MKVAVWGTFDGLHPGHREFLQRAAVLGELYVVVVPDEVVLANKGKAPVHPEMERQREIAGLPYVTRCYIDAVERGLSSLLHQVRPNVFCLGYDQVTNWEERLSELVMEAGLSVEFRRLNKYADGIHSRHIRDHREESIGPDDPMPHKRFLSEASVSRT